MNRYEETRGKPVVSRAEGAIVGKFDDFQFALKGWKIFGYRLRSTSMFGKAGGISADELDQVGTDVVFIGSRDQVEWSGGGRNSEDGRAWASRYLGTKIISRDGTSLGEVEDLLFDPGERRVAAVVLTGERVVELGHHIHTGAAAVVLEDASAAMPLVQEEDEEAPTDWWSRVRETWSGKVKEERDEPESG